MKEAPASYPSFIKQPFSPELPGGAAAGIEVTVPAQIYLSTSETFPLHGAFRVSRQEAGSFPRHLHHAVVVLLCGPSPATVGVGEGQLLFDDDLVDEGEWIRGFFNLDLFTAFNLIREPNRFWVSASIFRHVSNIAVAEMLAGRDPHLR